MGHSATGTRRSARKQDVRCVYPTTLRTLARGGLAVCGLLLLLLLSACTSSETAALSALIHTAHATSDGRVSVGPRDPFLGGQGGVPPLATIPPTLPAQTWAILSDPAHGLSIAYPATWTTAGAIAQPGGVTFSNFDVSEYPYSDLLPPLLSVTVSIVPNRQQLTPGDYYNTMVSSLGADTSGPTTTSTTTLANQDALVVTSEGTIGRAAPSITYYLPDGSLPDLVIIHVSDPDADSQHVLPRMLASLNLSQ